MNVVSTHGPSKAVKPRPPLKQVVQDALLQQFHLLGLSMRVIVPLTPFVWGLSRIIEAWSGGEAGKMVGPFFFHPAVVTCFFILVVYDMQQAVSSSLNLGGPYGPILQLYSSFPVEFGFIVTTGLLSSALNPPVSRIATFTAFMPAICFGNFALAITLVVFVTLAVTILCEQLALKYTGLQAYISVFLLVNQSYTTIVYQKVAPLRTTWVQIMTLYSAWQYPLKFIRIYRPLDPASGLMWFNLIASTFFDRAFLRLFYVSINVNWKQLFTRILRKHPPKVTPSETESSSTPPFPTFREATTASQPPSAIASHTTLPISPPAIHEPIRLDEPGTVPNFLSTGHVQSVIALATDGIRSQDNLGPPTPAVSVVQPKETTPPPDVKSLYSMARNDVSWCSYLNTIAVMVCFFMGLPAATPLWQAARFSLNPARVPLDLGLSAALVVVALASDFFFETIFVVLEAMFVDIPIGEKRLFDWKSCYVFTMRSTLNILHCKAAMHNIFGYG
ncbi:hypothetical protein HDU96_010714 [Phlyctochytrium bullatum]|nr:hypothetical protein HDU96_010714 [Phlyctochytrium bullatum]